MITFYTDKEGKRRVRVGSATPRKGKDVRLKNMNRAQRRSLLYGHTRIYNKIYMLQKEARAAGIKLPRYGWSKITHQTVFEVGGIHLTAKGHKFVSKRVPNKLATGYYSMLLNIVQRELSRERNELCKEV